MSQKTKNGRRGSIPMAIFWMFFISLLLFWLPFVGPLIAGVIGGKRAGGIFRGIQAVFLPAVVFGLFAGVAASLLTGWPLIGMVAAAGGMILWLSHVGPLLLGAIVGGFLA